MKNVMAILSLTFISSAILAAAQAGKPSQFASRSIASSFADGYDCVKQIGNWECGAHPDGNIRYEGDPKYNGKFNTECRKTITAVSKSGRIEDIPLSFYNNLGHTESRMQFLDRVEQNAPTEPIENLKICGDVHRYQYKTGGAKIPENFKFDLGEGGTYLVHIVDDTLSETTLQPTVAQRILGSNFANMLSFFAGSSEVRSSHEDFKFSRYYFFEGDEAQTLMQKFEDHVQLLIDSNALSAQEPQNVNSVIFSERAVNWEIFLKDLKSQKVEAIVRTDLAGQTSILKVADKGWFLYDQRIGS